MKDEKVIGNVKKIYFILIVLVVLVLVVASFSYAMFTYSTTKQNAVNIKTGTIDVSMTSTQFVNSNQVVVDANSTKNFDILITNNSGTDAKYNLYYTLSNNLQNVDVNYTIKGDTPPDKNGAIISKVGNDGYTRNISIYINNPNSSSVTVSFGVGAGLSNKDLAIPNGANVLTKAGTEFVYDYSGKEEVFVVPYSGIYNIEAWGAQGGGWYTSNEGGKGGYTSGNIYLKAGDKLYLNVGGVGTSSCSDSSVACPGGYNGGGDGTGDGQHGTGGGGATSIAYQSGLLSTLESNKDKVLIVAGGGGGSGTSGVAGAGGGKNGTDGYDSYNKTYTNGFTGTGASQTAPGYAIQNKSYTGSFGKGSNFYNSGYGGSGGGGGYYGGGGSDRGHGGAGGGSGYVSTSLNNAKTIAGTESIPSHDGKTTITGNNGNGYIKISALDQPVCKRATTLHTEICSNEDNSRFCQADGYALNDTITYGNLGTNGILTSGDAFDCDVNGDGVYDSETERFYYVSNVTNGVTTNTNAAVLIYYNNVSGGVASNSTSYAYDESGKNNNGPVTAIKQLPTTNQWKNVSLTNTTRAITNEQNGNTTSAGNLPTAFSYAGYSARLLTAQEVSAGCGFKVGSATAGELSSKCKYLMENTKYSSSSLKTYGGWLESPFASRSDCAWFVNAYNRNVDYSTVGNAGYGGVRPAIEVLKSNISY